MVETISHLWHSFDRGEKGGKRKDVADEQYYVLVLAGGRVDNSQEKEGPVRFHHAHR